MNAITPRQALKGREHAIVNARTEQVYDLYRTKDEAVRISRDLNARYGEGSYYPAKVDFGGGR